MNIVVLAESRRMIRDLFDIGNDVIKNGYS